MLRREVRQDMQVIRAGGGRLRVERLALSFSDRADIAAGLRAGWGIRRIARDIGRDPSVVSREVRRNATRTRGYRPVFADCAAERRRRRPQSRVVGADPVLSARVRADLRRSRTPRQIAARLRLEASDASVGLMPGSLAAEGKTVSHEAIYRWIYALPKGELAREGILLRSRRTARRRRRPLGERTGGKIIGMVSIDDRDPDVAGRRVPGGVPPSFRTADPYRIFTGKDGITCQGSTGNSLLSSARKQRRWWSRPRVLLRMSRGSSVSARRLWGTG